MFSQWWNCGGGGGGVLSLNVIFDRGDVYIKVQLCERQQRHDHDNVTIVHCFIFYFNNFLVVSKP